MSYLITLTKLKVNRSLKHFPVLVRPFETLPLALDLLAAPASQAYTERLFSV